MSEGMEVDVMSGPEIGRLLGSSVGLTGLFAISSAAAGDFTPLWFFIGIITITLIVLMSVVGGSWAGYKAYLFFSGKYFNYELGKVMNTDVLPPAQDPYSHVP